MPPADIAVRLRWLSYPGFSHLRQKWKPVNPALLIAAALVHADLETRLVEALPWVLCEFHDLDWMWLTAQCRLGNHQNRLGFLVSLALKLKKMSSLDHLGKALEELERSRLVAEGTLCRDSMSAAERNWARQYRPEDAAHWNLLTTLTVHQLTHAS
jgi:hypothetical protein